MSRILILSTLFRPDPLRRLDALEGGLERGLVVVKKAKICTSSGRRRTNLVDYYELSDFMFRYTTPGVPNVWCHPVSSREEIVMWVYYCRHR